MVKTYVPDPAGMGQPISLATAAVKAWDRAKTALTPQSPFKIGEAVVGDDPFSGRREGIVVVRERHCVGVKTAHGVVFFDRRQVRPLD